MLMSSQFVGDDVVVQHSLYREGQPHSLHSIFRYMAHGYSADKIRRMQADILPENIQKVREILAERNKHHFPDTQGNRALHDFKVLVDENVSPLVVLSLRKHFRKVAHVNHVGLNKQKDDRVWNYALDNGYNIIFTHDRKEDKKDQETAIEIDLTSLATQDARSILRAMDRWGNNNFILSDLPMIIHLAGGCDPDAELKKLLRHNKEKLFDRLDNRATPYLDIINGKIISGPTYFELKGINYIEDNKIHESSLMQKKSTRELFKSMWLGRLSPQEIRNMTPQREKELMTRLMPI